MAKSTSRTGLSIIIFAIALAGALVIAGVIKSQRNTKQTLPITPPAQASIDGIILPKDITLKEFHLLSGKDLEFNNSSLTGHWTLMFFGFTHCPYVCPTTMTELGKMYQTLEKTLPKQQIPQVVMVSVDPARDSLDVLEKYVHQFNPHFQAAYASEIELTKLAKQLNVNYNKIPATDGVTNDYTMTHSAQILVIDPKGNFHAYLSYPHNADEMTRDFIKIVSMYNAYHPNRST